MSRATLTDKDVPENLFSATAPTWEEEEEKEERKVYPSEERRKNRAVLVTFSDQDIPERIRSQALEWKMIAPDGRSPAVSKLVEYLLMPRLEAAEQGLIEPP